MATTTMSVATIQNGITTELAAKLAASGFRKESRYLIARSWGDGIAQVKCALWNDRFSGSPKAAMTFGVRFEDVQALVGQPEDDPDISTIATPSHLLHEDQRDGPWNAEQPGLAMILFDEVQTFGVPFFQMYSNIDNVLLSLKSENPLNWFTLGPNNRLLWLFAILAVRREKDTALTLLDKEIELRRDRPYGDRWRFDQLRERIHKL